MMHFYYLVFALLFLFTVIVAHAVLSRLVAKRGGPRSPQLFLVKIIILMHAALVLGLIGMGFGRGYPSGEIALGVIYASVVYYGIAYSYFHWFNMSETSRRVRIMMEIRERGGMPEKELEELYRPEQMIAVRLDRLIRAGQIERGPDGRYRIKGMFLLRVARIIQLWRKLCY